VSTLRWHDADVTGEWRLRRFSFSLDEFDVLNKTVDVSCEVSLCAADDRHPTMPRVKVTNTVAVLLSIVSLE
jgi:hypothetical protein